MSARMSTLLLGGSAVVSVAAVGAALVSQHVFGMEPCPWCVLQRVIFLAVALVCLAGLGLRAVLGPLGTRIGAALAVLLALSGVASALWQHFVAAASQSCNLTLAAKIVGNLQLDSLAPEVFAARASCMDAAVKLAGISYEFYSLALFLLIVAGGLRLLWRPAS
jgi:disulfide bond formation protein DsbB